MALKDRLQEERFERTEEAGAPLESNSTHPADGATDESDHDVAFSLLAADENALAEVEAAIQRLHRGAYGYCEATGDRIPAARLRALPWCRYTVVAERSRAKPKI